MLDCLLDGSEFHHPGHMVVHTQSLWWAGHAKESLFRKLSINPGKAYLATFFFLKKGFPALIGHVEGCWCLIFKVSRKQLCGTPLLSTPAVLQESLARDPAKAAARLPTHRAPMSDGAFSKLFYVSSYFKANSRHYDIYPNVFHYASPKNYYHVPNCDYNVIITVHKIICNSLGLSTEWGWNFTID